MRPFTYSIGSDTRITFPAKPDERVRRLPQGPRLPVVPVGRVLVEARRKGAADVVAALDRLMMPRKPDGACWRCQSPEGGSAIGARLRPSGAMPVTPRSSRPKASPTDSTSNSRTAARARAACSGPRSRSGLFRGAAGDRARRADRSGAHTMKTRRQPTEAQRAAAADAASGSRHWPRASRR